jgi:arginase
MSSDNLIFYEKKKLSGNVSVLGVPLDLGKDASGTELAPAYIRNSGLKKMCEEIGLSYRDLGDIECADKIVAPIGDIKLKYLDEIVRVAEESAKIVKNEIQAGNKMVVLGGDHTISIGNISGASVACGGDIGLVWIDAHGDINTDETSISGNVHGMPVSAVMGLGNPKLTGVLQPGAKVKPENIIHIGSKDLDQAEVDIMRNNQIAVFTIMDIVRQGLEPIMESLINLQKRVKHVWISMDVDSIDSLYSPATPMHTPDGLTRREIVNLTRFIGRTNKVAGFDLVEVAPRLDVDNKTGILVLELAANLLGGEYGWYEQYMKHEEEKQIERGRKM